MVRQRRLECESNMYHVVARGVGRQLIFEDDVDRFKFLEYLGELKESRVTLYAWCLMDNHVHLLVRAEIEVVSSAIGLLFGSYAQWFNLRHGRTGHLFQNRFDSECVESDSYFLSVIRYIHQNPLKAGMASSCVYRWSSYAEYFERPRLCDTALALDMLGGCDGFRAFHETRKDDTCLDIGMGRTKTRGMSDSDALAIARKISGLDNLFDVASLDRDSRDGLLRRMCQAGLTIRQIERFTGISKSTVQRIGFGSRGQSL